ncbi:MAG: sulfatase-like hydrolase/transferase [Pseudomonadota bacterium]
MTLEFFKTNGMKVLWVLPALAVLHLVLIQPNHPDAVSWHALLLFPLELPAIVLGLMAFGQSRAGLYLRIALVLSLTTIAALKAADFTMFVSLSRGFNLVADFPLIISLYQLVVGAFGAPKAVLLIIVAFIALIGVTGALWWACRTVSRLPLRTPVPVFAAIASIAATAIAVTEVGATMGKWTAPFKAPGTAFTARVGVERYEMMRDTLAELRIFRTAARQDPFARKTKLFDSVDRDVLVIFIESYGRTSFDTPLFADLHLETLQQAEQTLLGEGLAMASTFLTAPTQGGQSWLTHATFANGLWVDNQTRYRAALNSGRKTLFHLAAEAGFHTAAVMPQITLDWPESRSLGFDTILAAADLGYEGAAFNWVTMPDQFTFAAMDRLLPSSDQYLFVQVATGSSHAPWIPVPALMDWDDLGDGTVFNELVASSEQPSDVWRDNDRVRAQYRLAVDYALQTVFAYAQRRAEEPPLMLIIGDHQAAGFVALDERPHVPMHVIGPKYLVDLVADDDFVPGLIPSPNAELRPMSDLRAHLVRSLTSTELAGVEP